MELDNICIFNKSMNLIEASDIYNFGCDSVSGLNLNYNFNQRRAQSPDLFDAVSGTYNGVSRTYVDRDTDPVDECNVAALTLGNADNLTACENAMVPAPFQGMFSQRLMLDLGADIGPVSSNRGSPDSTSSTSAKLNVIRSTSKNSSHEISINAQCKGSCKRFTVTILPSDGVLCFTSPKESQSLTCNDTDIISVNTVVPLIVGNTEFVNFIRPHKAVPIYYYPLADSLPGQRDSFKLMADTNGTTGETALLTVQIITNTPPEALDAKVQMAEGATAYFHLPGQSEHLYAPDGNRESIQAILVRLEYDHLVANPPEIKVYGANGLLDVKMPYHQEDEHVPQYTSTTLRNFNIAHAGGSGTGEDLVTVVYRLDDGIDIGPEAKLIVSVTYENKPPVVTSGTISVVEDYQGGIPISLSFLTTDAEGDAPLWRVTKIPENGRLFQVLVEGNTKGEEVLMTSASGTMQLWTDGSMGPTSTSEKLDAGVNKINGPPVLFPDAGQLPGTYTPALNWDHSDVTLVLFVREPIFLNEIAFFFTWGPGAVVQIETRPAYLVDDSDWQVVYAGANTQTSYCVDKPASDPCADITRHRLCPKPYKANSFRVTLSSASLDRSIAIDAVLAKGKSATASNIVGHPDGKLLWEPNQDFNGEDSLSFLADDCPAFQVLQMDTLERLVTQQGTIKANITAVNDAPKVRLQSLDKIVASADRSEMTPILFSWLDVDSENNDVSLTIAGLPNFGSLWIADSSDEGGNNRTGIDTTFPPGAAGITYEEKDGSMTNVRLVEDTTTVVGADMELRYQPGQCKDFGIQDVSFRVTVQDAEGESSTQEIELSVDCTKLPLRWVVDLPGESSVSFGIFCGVLGLLSCAVAICFNLAFRKHMTVRLSSFRVNVAMYLGCALIFTALVSMSLDRPSADCFVDGEPEGFLDASENITSAFTGDCPNINCFSRIWLLDCGAAITWGSLYAKTYRIKSLFMAKSFRTKSFTDKDIGRGVAMYLLVTVLVLVGFSAYIGWPEFDFTTNPVALSSTANEKLVTVSATCGGGDAYNALSYVSLAAFTLLMGFSAQIAFGIRNVDLKQVNDSKQMAFAIYTSFVIGLPGIVVGSLVKSSDLSFVITVFAIGFATMAVVLSTTLPRMLDVYYRVEVKVGPTSSNGGPMASYVGSSVASGTLKHNKSQLASDGTKNKLDSQAQTTLVETFSASDAPAKSINF